jgi:hypothetical protein
LTEAMIRWTRGDQVLLAADHGARAAYEERMTQMINSSRVPAEQERSAA